MCNNWYRTQVWKAEVDMDQSKWYFLVKGGGAKWSKVGASENNDQRKIVLIVWGIADKSFSKATKNATLPSQWQVL